MKTNGNGCAKILSPSEINRLFERGFISPRDKLLFALTYYCACRISEALALTTDDEAFRRYTLRGEQLSAITPFALRASRLITVLLGKKWKNKI